MTKTLEKSGRTVDEALRAALAELGLDVDDVCYQYQVVQLPKSGFLGIGALPAVVRVEYETPDEPAAQPAPAGKPEAPAPKKEEPKKEEPRPAPAPEKEPKKPAEKPAAPKKPESRPAPRPEKEKKEPAKPAGPAVESVAVPAAEAEADANADYAAIRTFLTGLFERMGIQADMEIGPRENGGVSVQLSGSGLGAIIGHRGETLDAIQHLTNYVVNRGSDRRLHISVDAEGYRKKREEALTRLAEKMAEKAVKYKRSMALEPMNSYERHVIHTALQNYEGVTTSSTGVEPNRRVVVSYVRPETPGNRPQSREWA